MITNTSLGSGLRVVTEAMPGSHTATLGFWVDAGSRDEVGPEWGASHFLEHLLFKGTDTRSAKDIAEAIDAVGGDMNAFTTKEYTAYYARLIDRDLDLGLDILCDIMESPAFRQEEVDAERQVILEEISMHEDEPSDLVHELVHEAAFPSHPLGKEVLGSRSTITEMTPERIRSYFEERYRPTTLVFAAAGNVDHETVVAGVEKRFQGRAGIPASRPLPQVSTVQPVNIRNRATEQAHLVVGMRALDRDDEDRFALSLLNQVLGGGMSSRLFQEIREKRGLAYSVFSYRAAYQDSGMLAIYAGTAPDRAGQVLDLIDVELDRLAADGVTERELTIAKGQVTGSLALALEDSSGRMSRIGRSQLLHDRVLSFEEVVARTEAVDHEQLQRLAARIFANDRVLAVVGPFEQDAFADRAA